MNFDIRIAILFTLLSCLCLLLFYILFRPVSHKVVITNEFIANNASICLFLPSAVDDFPFVQGIITSVDEFWPKGVGKKIHWIDNYYGELPFKYGEGWTIVKTATPNISVPVMKQQYNSYVSYKYCLPDEFIAMIDSDSPFITKVKYNMIFNTNKRPHILYTLKYRDARWDPRKILKSNNPNWGDVMFTYPIVMKTKHVEEIYSYIERVHNDTLVNLMEKYIFGQFGIFLEFIHIMNYDNQYSLIDIEENPFPPRCSIHLPYSYVSVKWENNRRRIMVRKHQNIQKMNKLIYYLIEQGKCVENRSECKEFHEDVFKKNSYTVEVRYKHYFLRHSPK